MTSVLRPRAGRESARADFVRLAELPETGAERDRLRATLVERHLPLVRHFARRYAGRGEPLDDLLQAGSVGLVKAVDRFDPGRGLEFSTYAAPTILGEIRRHFRDRTWAVHVHRQPAGACPPRSPGCAAELTQELSRAPSVAELAARSGRTEEEVLEALDCAAAYSADSLDAPAGEDRTARRRLGVDDQAWPGSTCTSHSGRRWPRCPNGSSGSSSCASTATGRSRRSGPSSGSRRCTSPACWPGRCGRCTSNWPPQRRDRGETAVPATIAASSRLRATRTASYGPRDRPPLYHLSCGGALRGGGARHDDALGRRRRSDVGRAGRAAHGDRGGRQPSAAGANACGGSTGPATLSTAASRRTDGRRRQRNDQHRGGGGS